MGKGLRTHLAATQEATTRVVARPTLATAETVHMVPCPTARSPPSATRYIMLLARMSRLQLSNQLLASTYKAHACVSCAKLASAAM
jgi:hypothetical protein